MQSFGLFDEKSNDVWRQATGLATRHSMQDTQAQEIALFNSEYSPFLQPESIYKSTFDTITTNTFEHDSVDQVLFTNKKLDSSHSWTTNTDIAQVIAQKPDYQSNSTNDAYLDQQYRSDRTKLTSEQEQHLANAKKHALQGWNEIPNSTREKLQSAGYHVEVFRNQQEYYNKYHDEGIFEKRGAVGFTSRKHHLIAVFSEPIPGKFSEPEVNIANVVFHECGHALNNVKGEEFVRLAPDLIDKLKIRQMDYAAPELTWFDGVWADKLKACGKDCPQYVLKQLNYYLEHGAGEMFAECFALAHGHGSDPQLDHLIVKHFGAAIELLKGPNYV